MITTTVYVQGDPKVLPKLVVHVLHFSFQISGIIFFFKNRDIFCFGIQLDIV